MEAIAWMIVVGVVLLGVLLLAALELKYRRREYLDFVQSTKGMFHDAKLDTAQYFEWKREEGGGRR
jgi:hypothetical protein